MASPYGRFFQGKVIDFRVPQLSRLWVCFSQKQVREKNSRMEGHGQPFYAADCPDALTRGS